MRPMLLPNAAILLVLIFLTSSSCDAFSPKHPLHHHPHSHIHPRPHPQVTTPTRTRSTLKAAFKETASTNQETSSSEPNNNNNNNKKKQPILDPKLINDFCISTNTLWSKVVIPPIQSYIQTRPAFTSQSDILSKLTAPPEVPGISRPVWLVILGSVPTALGWYGYYKFSIEEELYQYELEQGQYVSGCGGYGTLLPFVFGVIIGFPMQLLHIPLGGFLVESAALWILLGQVNLYRRVNELCMPDSVSNDEKEVREQLGLSEPPLYEWWALLPPPLDVVVGLRQVHFLSEFWRLKRGEAYDKDIVAEELFPFISSERFTLKEFVTEPKRWFWFTKKWEDIDLGQILK